MGRHKEWRAVAKKMMRKAKRQKIAQARDALLSEERQARERSPRYQAWLCEQEALEQFEREEGARLQRERHAQWERDEELAQQAWAERQEKMTKARQERATQEQKIREIWEEEQKKLKEAEDEKNKKKEEKQQAQEELMKHIDDFINNGKQLPPSLTLTKETNPDKPVCPFFSKTGACRFGDRCSRNHPRPAISKVLLIANFYSHFVLNQFETDEYDTDVMLEYEDSERYQHFKEFYNDVLPEFEHHGRVVQFKVCRNFEPHLRGNVYVEYMKTRDAVTAFQKFQGRWYGGRQLSIEFTAVTSWKSAICGLFFKGRCPKGKGCNFLHVFRNPGNAFASADNDYPLHSSQRRRSWSRSPSRSSRRSGSPGRRGRRRRSPENGKAGRWSESPEREDRRDREAGERRRSRERSSSHRKHRRRRSSGDDQSPRGRNHSLSRSHRKEKRRRSRSRSLSK
ncbi:U2 small nuclear ribonucleoprotein auxiliary factor 35 kDa subunit-related protein 2 isoform X2 [Bacillus rossius redtenbacheri]|uniref:U2 small nuclear ribonucleoprotein auxiliary factor 35 kDa subunit-related protein 2 isoform X2 n=1 Tax=Bacillus rossius redtenbacheri TaxID=93214 RepID=UPI002FDDF6CF